MRFYQVSWDTHYLQRLFGNAIFICPSALNIRECFRRTQKGGMTDEESTMSGSPMRSNPGLLPGSGLGAGRMV